MSEPTVEVLNQTRFVVDAAAVARLATAVLVAEGVVWGELGVQFVGEHHVRLLNRDHLGDDHVTDVLAFPLETVLLRKGVPVRREPDPQDDNPRLLGDVVICLVQAARQAARAKLPLALEVALLLVHGTLHVVGYDHDVDAGQMALRQAELLDVVVWEGLVAQG